MGRVRDLDVRTIRIGIAALVVLAIVVFVLVKAIGGGDSNDNGNGSSAPVGLSEGQLIDKAAGLGHIVYWVGPRPGTDQYEFTATSDGRIYVRYLTGDAQPGDPSSNFLSVGTYVIHNAASALDQGAAQQNAAVIEKPGYNLLKGTHNNAYVVFANEPDLQIEVYSPRPGEAMKLASSGALRQVGR